MQAILQEKEDNNEKLATIGGRASRSTTPSKQFIMADLLSVGGKVETGVSRSYRKLRGVIGHIPNLLQTVILSDNLHKLPSAAGRLTSANSKHTDIHLISRYASPLLLYRAVPSPVLSRADPGHHTYANRLSLPPSTK